MAVFLNKVSFFRKYGVLCLPVILMIVSGLFGTRPSRKILHIVSNLLFIANFTLVIAITVAFIVKSPAYEDALLVFNNAFCMIISANFIFLFRACYRQYNIMASLDDTCQVRIHRLGKKHVIHICAMFCVVLGALGYVSKLNYTELSVRLRTDEAFKWVSYFGKSRYHVVNVILAIQETVVYAFVAWVSVLSPILTVSVICVILAEEFKECVAKLEESVAKEGFLSDDNFLGAVERFKNLAGVVSKADELFCHFVGLSLFLSIGILCASVYSLSLGMNKLEEWMMGMMLSVVILVILVPPATALNNKVWCFVCCDNNKNPLSVLS